MTTPPPDKRKHTIRNIVIAVLAILFLLWMIGTCAGPGRKKQSPAAGTTSTSTSTQSTSVVDTTTSAKSEPLSPSHLSPPPGKVLAGPESSCTTDAASSPINLTGVTVKVGTLAGHAGISATVRFTYAGVIPQTGTVLWSLLASKPDGRTVQLGYKTLDGQRIGYFYFPFSEGQQHNMDGLADQHTPGEIGLFMPQSALDILGPTWWWTAVVNIEGRDIAFCPARS